MWTINFGRDEPRLPSLPIIGYQHFPHKDDVHLTLPLTKTIEKFSALMLKLFSQEQEIKLCLTLSDFYKLF